MFFLYSEFSLILCIQISFFVTFILKQEHQRFSRYSKSWFLYIILLLVLSLMIGVLSWFILSFLYELFFAIEKVSVSNMYLMISYPLASFILTFLSIRWIRRFN